MQSPADTLSSPHSDRGIGHGVVSLLERWADTERHRAEIVGVMVAASVCT